MSWIGDCIVWLVFGVIILGMIHQGNKAKRLAKQHDKLWRISQAVQLHTQNDLAGLQQFYDYVRGVVGGREEK